MGLPADGAAAAGWTNAVSSEVVPRVPIDVVRPTKTTERTYAMARPASFIGAACLLSCLAGLTGCASYATNKTGTTHRNWIQVWFPGSPTRVHVEGDWSKVGDKYPHWLERELFAPDWDAGRVDLGAVTLTRPGYADIVIRPSSISLNDASLDRSSWAPDSSWEWEYQKYPDPDGWQKVHKRQYRYRASIPWTLVDSTLRLVIVANSEPRGASIYLDGRFMGSTPESLVFRLRPDDCSQGSWQCGSLTFAKDGYLPRTVAPLVDVPTDRWGGGSEVSVTRYRLVLLDRDPNAPAVIQQASSGPRKEDAQDHPVSRQAYEAALREYNDAVAAWEAAMRDCDNCGLNAGAINNAASGSSWASLLDALGTLAKQEAARKLKIAVERLERAKAKLQALEWR